MSKDLLVCRDNEGPGINEDLMRRLCEEKQLRYI